MTLRRKTQLKRTALKRTKRKLGRFKKPMRNATPKRAKRNREVADFRYQLCMEVGRCECCGNQLPAYRLCCHEIAGGSADRRKALDQRCAILVVDFDCHTKVQNEPKATQLARLWLSRPADVDLVAFNRIRGRADGAITMDELEAAVKLLEVKGQRRTA